MELGESGGSIYQEIDWAQDLVVRQVNSFDGVYEYGEWTGTRLVGYICDQNPSGLGVRPEEEITKEEFEAVWRLAHEQGTG
jgi:hypothetical protein